MAHITEFKIDGLLGRKEPIHLALNRGVNVFFGENGCGKTTLLKVLNAALSGDGTAMERLPVTKAVVDIYSIARDRVYRHIWERSVEPPGRDIDPVHLELLERRYIETRDERYLFSHGGQETEWKLSPTRRRVGNPAGWSHTFLPTTRLYLNEGNVARSVAGRAQASEAEFDQAFKDSVNRIWLQFNTKTLTEVRNIQESGLRTVLREVLNPGASTKPSGAQDVDAVYARVNSFLERQSHTERISLGSANSFRSRYEKDTNLRHIVDNLDDVEQRIELTMAPINRFLTTISNLFSRGKSLKMTNSEIQILLADERVLPISQLSSGEKQMIMILLSAMTGGPNAILIDEPELSLHIDWQRVFVETIASLNPDCQLLLATHSPEIMAELPDECIFKL